MQASPLIELIANSRLPPNSPRVTQTGSLYILAFRQSLATATLPLGTITDIRNAVRDQGYSFVRLRGNLQSWPRDYPRPALGCGARFSACNFACLVAYSSAASVDLSRKWAKADKPAHRTHRCHSPYRPSDKAAGSWQPIRSSPIVQAISSRAGFHSHRVFIAYISESVSKHVP